MKKILCTMLIVAFITLFIFNEKASALTSYTDASPISVNQEYMGTLGNADDHFYKITLPTAGQLKVSMENVTDKKWEVTIRDSKANELEYFTTDSTDYADGSNFTKVGLPAGTYYIVIGNYSSARQTAYKFKTSFTESNYYEKEFNDTVTIANPIELNKTYEGIMSDSYDKDFYKVNLTDAGKINVKMKNISGVTWQVYILNGKGETLKSFKTDSSELVKGNTDKEIGLAKGTYYVQVESYSYGSDQPYKLTVNYKKSSLYEKEFNNSITTANSISLNKRYKGTIQDSYDNDFYKIKLPSAGNVNLSISTRPGSQWYVHIQNERGDIYDYFYTDMSELVKGRSSINIGLPKGTYYIKVAPNNYAVDVPYTLEADFKASKTAYEKEFNDTLTTATKISLNKAVKGTLSNKNSSDKDFYKFVLSKTTNVKFTMTQRPGTSWENNIYDSKGNTVTYFYTDSSELAKKNYSMTLRLKKGTYYYRVSPNTSTVWKTYTLKISKK